jgi:hypothetical protein
MNSLQSEFHHVLLCTNCSFPNKILLGKIIEKIKINNVLILILLGNKILVGKIISTNQILDPLTVSCSTEILD